MKKILVLVGALALTGASGYAREALSSLHRAALRGDHKLVRSLVEVDGVDLDKQTENGNTALHIAGKRRDAETFNYLLANGANPSIKNKRGETPSFQSWDYGLGWAKSQIFKMVNWFR